MHLKTCGKPRPTFNCKQCGNEKEMSYSSTNQYCSTTCAQLASRIVKDDAWKKRKRAVQNEAWMRYQIRLESQTPDDADRKLIQDIYENCPVGYEVDHIVPISKGGLHHQDNLQYLTPIQNKSKGNRLNWSGL